MIISISHALLYVALAIIMGIVVLNIIPAEMRPKLNIPPRLLFCQSGGGGHFFNGAHCAKSHSYCQYV